MAIVLETQEKISIVQQHMKTLLYNEYNNQTSLSQAEAVQPVNQQTIDTLNNQLKNIAAQKTVLQNTLDSLNAQLASEQAAAAATGTTTATTNTTIPGPQAVL